MADEIIDDARLEAAQQLIEQGEGPRRKLIGPVAGLTSCAAVAMSLIQLYWAWATVTAQILRLVFLGFSLVLTFLIYPARRRQRHVSVSWQDWLLFLPVSPSSSIRCGILKNLFTGPQFIRELIKLSAD